MKQFYNEGCGDCIVLAERGKCVLVAAIERDEFVIAQGPIDMKGHWHYGAYYRDIGSAAKAFDQLTEDGE